MMSLNRYRLRHLSKTSNSAKRTTRLLERPDRLLSVILIGNNFANITASALATVIAVRLLGDIGVIVASVLLTIIILIFAEVSPKTLAALYPERIAFPASYILGALLWLFYPIVFLINTFSNGFLYLFGIKLPKSGIEPLSREELRTILHEAAGRIPKKHQSMLLSILDLEKVSVDDIMVPKNEVVGLDLENEWDAILGQLANCQHTYLPVFRNNLNKFVGTLHLKHALNLMASNAFNVQTLQDSLDKGYFVPEGTPLSTQLLNFQKNKKTVALVVNEYGDIQGLITLSDILEEIVGEFTTDMAALRKEVHPQEDGTYLVDGSANLRELNKTMNWNLPTDGPKTLSGLIIERLETIPEIGTCLLLTNTPVEVVHVWENRVKTARISPPLKTVEDNKKDSHEEDDET